MVVTPDDQRWVDTGFLRLEKLLSRWRMLEAEVVLPDAEHFPDPYDKSWIAIRKMLDQICTYMRVDQKRIALKILDEQKGFREMNETDGRPEASPYRGRPATLLWHRAKPYELTLTSSELVDPLAVAAVIAHELAHCTLMDSKAEADAVDHEPMADLLTVFVGFGVISANCAMRFKSYPVGCLPEEVYGYALAKFAVERGEEDPAWVSKLCTNVKAFYRASRALLDRPSSAVS